MTDNVIDALVVTLGLNSKGFNDGIQGATESLTGFATKVAGLAIGFKGLEAGIQYFEKLHAQLSDLYFTGRNLGVFGTELSRLGELAQLFGGNMEDAAGSVNTLQSAVFNLRFKGQMSESLQMLQRFGVSYLTAQGHMRDPEAIARDAAVAIERQAQAAGLNSGERFQLAQSFGLQGGLASAAAAGPTEFDAQLARSRRDQSGLTEGALRGQAMLGRDVTSRHEQRDVLNSTVLTALIPAIEKINELLQDLARKGIPLVVTGINAATGFLEHPPAWFADLESNLKNLVDALGPGGSLVLALGALKAPVVTLGVGLGYLIDKLDEKFGGHTVTAAGNWIGGLLSRQSEYDPNAVSGVLKYASRPWNYSLPIPAPPVTPLASRPHADPGASKSTAQNGGGAGTTITFENVTVNSRGQDGNTLARDFTNTVRRSINVSGVDAGMVS